ncbi:MAG: SpoIIE family protein phosphatase [Lentisphaerae bacterium]|nr:SpoIIE family protein phosphatase [Lentisphaerota bacterium]
MEQPAEPIRVLLIEDDEEDYVIARELLGGGRGCRFDLHWADSLASGLQRAADGVDVILLDLTLPDSRGWETFERVSARVPQVPVILLTGLSDEALGVRAVQEGAEDYLIKGRLDAALLQRALRYAIERNKSREELKQVAEALRVRTEQMADDLRLARDVQQAMLLRQFPSFPPEAGREASLRFAHVYRPSRFVSGDFFHVLPLSGWEAGIFIGDVMGHGVRSALVAAILRGLLEEFRPVAGDPAILLTRLNRALIDILQMPDQLIFASAFYAVIDARTGGLVYANAGHPVPLCNRATTGETVPLPTEADQIGPALGMGRAPVYATVAGQLLPGDTMLIYTDGVCEAQNAGGQEYGRARVVGCMHRGVGCPVGALLRVVMEDLEAHVGGDEFDDDVCLVGMEFRQRMSSEGAAIGVAGGA